MHLPTGHTETQVLRIIEDVVEKLAGAVRIPGLDKDDMAQEIRLLCLEALPRFDADKGLLGGFLYTHTRNRILNMLRDKVTRNDAPCPRCAMGDYCQDGKPCAPFQSWRRRNTRKQNLAAVMPLDDGPERVDGRDYQDADVKEVLCLIDKELDVELRADWLRLRSGAPVPNQRRLEVERAVRNILAGTDVL